MSNLNDQSVLPRTGQQPQFPIEDQKILNLKQYIILSILTMGLYQIWWTFKTWRFFMQKENLNIMPAARAIFIILFLYPLFEKIQVYAKLQGYSKTFSSGWMFACFFAASLLSRLPDPYWLISIFGFVFTIPAFEALNFAMRKSNQFNVVEQEKFSTAQRIVIVLFSLFWLLIIFSLYLMLTGQVQ